MATELYIKMTVFSYRFYFPELDLSFWAGW